MIKLLGVRHKNTVIFEDAYLPLDYVGITQIRGENKDSKTGALKDPNAAGKSVLVRPIPEIIFASSPLTEGIKTKARRDLFTSSDSAFSLDIEHGGKNITVTKAAKGKSFEYIVEEDSKNIKVRRKDYTEAKIREMFGYTEDEFYTQWYIDSRRISPLQIGSAAKRLHFFTKFFRLDDTDETRKIFLAMLREAKLKKASYDTLLSEIKELGKLDPDIESLRKEYKRKKKEKDNVVKYIDTLKNEYVKKTQLLELLPKLQEYKNACEIVSVPVGEVKKAKAAFVEQVEKYEQNKTAVNRLAVYEKRLSDYERDSKRLQQANKEAKKAGLDVKKASRKVKDLSKQKHELQAKYKKQKHFITKAPKSFDFGRLSELKKKKFQKTEYYESNISKLEHSLETYESFEKELTHEHGKDGTCPLCQSKLSSKNKNLKSVVTDIISRNRGLLREERKLLKLANEYENLVEQEKEFKKAKKEILKAEKELKRIKIEYEKVSSLHKRYLKLEKIQDRYSDLEQPRKPEIDTAVCSDKEYFLFKNTLNNINLIHGMENKELDELNPKRLKKEISKLKKELAKNTVQDVSDRFIEVSTKLESELNKHKKHKQLSKKIKALQSDVDDIPVLETLVKAYSNKGFKLVLIQYLAAKLEKNLNTYAPLLYAEKIKFYIRVNSVNSFEILAERKINGSLRCSDVHTLSGAESRAFSFLLPLAILPMIPESRRLNVMVLDEPLQNMGEARKDLFVNSFIPKLKTLIPHIVILSTDNEYYKDSRILYVVKEKSKSRLETKHEKP